MRNIQSALFKVLELLLLLSTVKAGPSSKKEGTKLPSFVKVCHRSDPHLSDCVRNSLNGLKGRLSYGIPELYVPPIDPLIIPEIKLDQDSGSIYLHSTFKDIHIIGLSNFTLNELTVDATKIKLTMTMHFPSVSIKALYVMKGKLMMMPLVGEGEFRANITDVKLNTVLQGQLYKKGGQSYIKVKDIAAKYSLGKVKLRLENLFNGDPALGERMNTFLNENWGSLEEEVRPLMENALKDIVRASTVKLFNTYSYNDLLPE